MLKKETGSVRVIPYILSDDTIILPSLMITSV